MPIAREITLIVKYMQALSAEQASSQQQVFVGRQPIFDRELNTYGYELLFRPGTGNEARFIDGEMATAQVIHNTLMEFGLDELVGSGLAYINFTRESLIGDIANLLPPERVVLEILEDVEVDQVLIDGVKLLKDAGFTVALDDFQYEPKWEPLVSYASVIKFDVMATDVQEIKKQLSNLDLNNVKLLAEKVETQEEFEQLRELGFDYFQGYFFAKPKVITGNKLPDNHVAILNLIAKLQEPAVTIEEIEPLVSQNLALSYKLLRYINSAFFALPRKVSSIRQIVIFFGLQRLKNWASLLAMTEVDRKPAELIQTGLVRARACELLAQCAGRPKCESYFMAGLFSILDALMDHSMSEVLEKLPIDDRMASALLEYEGELGEVLKCCIACEQNNWPDMKLERLKEGAINRAYLDAMIWSREVVSGFA